MEFISENLEDTKKIAFDFAQHLISLKEKKRDTSLVVGLYGYLGSGKTTFMKYLCQYFGLKENIHSPTFVIMKKYNLNNISSNNFSLSQNFHFLYHIDAYRIEKEEEILNLNWKDIINNSNNIICVEWPEKISSIMPKHIVLKFDYIGKEENKRKIKIEF